MPNTTKITYGIYCEHIRTEANGQTTLLGIWGEDCIVKQLPFEPAALCIHYHISNDEAAPINGKLELILPGSSESIITPFAVPLMPDKRQHNLNFIFNGIKITEYGKVVANLTITNPDPIQSQKVLNIIKTT